MGKQTNKVIAFLGRNIEGIINDARDNNIEIDIVIKRFNDNLTFNNIENYKVITTSDFDTEIETNYTVICNGGTTEQQIPIITKIVNDSWFKFKVNYEFIIIEKDKTIKILDKDNNIFI